MKSGKNTIGAWHCAKIDFSDAVSCGDYLALDQILSAQHPCSPNHEEMLFHRAAPDQRTVNQADAARDACLARHPEAERSGAGVQDAGTFRHVTRVERIFGFKTGIRGTAAVSYRRKMLNAVLFPELFSLRTTQ